MLKYRMREGCSEGFPRPENMPAPLHALLIRRGIRSAEDAERFLHPSVDQLRDPFLLHDMRAAVDLIRAAVEGREPICVYGDYDVDGVSASALLTMYLRSLGAEVEAYLPSRHSEGYGLNENAIREIAARSGLLVTVDCGVTSVDLIALAKSLGLKCVVTDHHQPSEALPDCPVVNPLLGDYPFGFLCGAGVAFKLVCAMGGLSAAMAYIDIAALATVADVVPLTDENRVIVKLGLERINDSPRVGLAALRDAARLGDREITAGNIGFQLAPRLNAGGRLGSARRSYDLLTAQTAAEAAALASELEQENTRRKDVERQIVADCESQLKHFDFLRRRAIVLAGADWNPGVIGLAASRIVEKYHYPVILLSARDGILTGSCRSIVGVDIYAALCATQNHLIKFGGHKQAAGLTLAESELDGFRDDLDEYLRRNIPSACYIPDAEYDLEIHFDALTPAFVGSLEALSPTGFGNPMPVFRTTDVYLRDARSVGLNGAHLRLNLSEYSQDLTAIAFGMGEMAGTLGESLDVLFSPKFNVWQGKTIVEAEVKAIRAADTNAELAQRSDNEDCLLLEYLLKRLCDTEVVPPRIEAEDADIADVASMIKDHPQGTLILAGDVSIAGTMVERFGEGVDLCFGGLSGDPRCFNTVCVYPPAEIEGSWRNVVLAGIADGVNLPPTARVLRLNVRPKWTEGLPDLEGFRQIYKRFLGVARTLAPSDFDQAAYTVAKSAGSTFAAAACALLTLRALRLIDFDPFAKPLALRSLPKRKVDPEACAVWRVIQRWKL